MMDRRSFLRGLSLGAGASVLGPMLHQVHAQAEGQIPRRLVICMAGNGCNPGMFWPKEVNRIVHEDKLVRGVVDRPFDPDKHSYSQHRHYDYETPLVIRDFEMDRGAMAPLAPYKDEVAIIHGLSNEIAGGGHYTNYGALSCARGTGSPGGITIDTLIGDRIGRDTPFPVLRMGIVDWHKHRIQSKLQDSALGPGRPAPVIMSPQRTFNSLFGSVAAGAGMAKFQKRSQLLDALSESSRTAIGRLSGDSKLKMESYLYSLETLRERQSRLAGREDALRSCMPGTSDAYESVLPNVRMGANFELAAAALTCGLTRVVMHSLGSGTSTGVKWLDAGDDVPGGHAFGHGASYQGKNSAYWTTQIWKSYAEHIAGLIERLKSVPEGNGSMWDHTTILFQTSNHESHHSRTHTWPAMLIGSAGGRLRTDGRTVLYPYKDRPGARRVSNLYNTLGHAMGLELDDFGAEGGRGQGGPLSELLA